MQEKKQNGSASTSAATAQKAAQARRPKPQVTGTLRVHQTGAKVDGLKPPCRILLFWLLSHPLLSADVMALALNLDVSRIYQYVNQLLDAGLIERITPSVHGRATHRLYYLSNRGIHALAAALRQPPDVLAHVWHADEEGLQRLLPRVNALIGMRSLIGGLFTYAPAAQAQKGQRLAIRWYWLHDYRHRFLYRGKPLSCHADAVLLWRARPPDGAALPPEQGNEAGWYSAFVLVDLGLDDRTLMRQRLERMLAYRECAERWPVYRSFPAVLIVVDQPRRAEHWQRCMREVASKMRVEGLVGAITTLPDPPGKQDAPLNTWGLPWRHLSTNAPCHLQDVLSCLPATALPPGVLHHAEHAQQAIASLQDGPAVPPTTATCVVEGNFARRAKSMFGQKQGGVPGDRETLALLSQVLARRHFDLLTLLANHAAEPL